MRTRFSNTSFRPPTDQFTAASFTASSSTSRTSQPSRRFDMSAEFLSSVFSLDGKCAIVTGGTGGLGLEMSTTLAKAGADIISIQLPNDPLADGLAKAVESTGRKLKVFECNVADSKQLRGCFAKIWESGITPDILLNCAGIMRRGPILDITDDDLDAVWIRSPMFQHSPPMC
jgi:hypothetical protein